ncbi:MAG: ankyrin repeat domain-containing protein, partial [Bacteroidota bacterium]
MKNLIFLFVMLAWLLNVQAQDNTGPFFSAARSNDVKTLKELLDKGFDVNAKNRYGVTALNFAADKGNLDAVNLLLEHGADPNLKDSFYGDTPLGWAIYKKNSPIILSMINHGGDLKNEDLVMSAAWNRLTEVVKLMLGKGAPGAGSVLMSSVGSQDTAMFVMVLDYVKHKDSLLSEALVNATALKNEKFMALLREAGGRMPEPKAGSPAGKADPSLGGEYVTKDMTKAELAVADEVLTASFDGSPPYRMKILSDSTYAFADFPGVTIGVLRVAGNVIGITLVQPGRIVSYMRAAEKVKKSGEPAPVTEDRAKVDKPVNWPSFRGVQATGTADGQHPPVTWDAAQERNLRWKT